MQSFKNFIKQLLTHWLPNLVLVAAVVVLIRARLVPFAVAAIVISKWQVFRAKPKVWPRSIRDNACDLVVATSAITLIWLASADLVLQIAVAGAYYLWLIVIKPLKTHVGIALQSAVCQFAALLVVFLLGRSLPAAAVVALAWLTGLIAADHLLTAFHERAHGIISLAWALLTAEAAWLFWNWLIVYSFFNHRLLLPQAPLVMSMAGYIFGSMYLDHSQTKLGKRRLFEYVVLFAGLTAILIFGTKWDTRL